MTEGKTVEEQRAWANDPRHVVDHEERTGSRWEPELGCFVTADGELWDYGPDEFARWRTLADTN